MRRKMGMPKVAIARVRAVRKTKVPFERYASLPAAIVEGKFLASLNSRVYVWRSRSGERPSWHTCEVMRSSADNVELWDETLGQWFCFDPKSVHAMLDVRMCTVETPSVSVVQSKTGCSCRRAPSVVGLTVTLEGTIASVSDPGSVVICDKCLQDIAIKDDMQLSSQTFH